MDLTLRGIAQLGCFEKGIRRAGMLYERIESDLGSLHSAFAGLRPQDCYAGSLCTKTTDTYRQTNTKYNSTAPNLTHIPYIRKRKTP